MSISSRTKIAGGAAAAAIGLLIGPAPAHAFPPAPLAPADCSSYVFPGGPVTLKYPSINAKTEFDALSGSPRVDNNATTRYPQSNMSGRVKGGFNGSDISLEVTRQGASREYSPLVLVGTVGDDGRAHGTYTYDQGSGNWDSAEVMKCVPAPPAPAQPAPVVVEKPAPAPAQPAPVAVDEPAPAPQEAPAPAPDQNVFCIPDPFDVNFPGAC